MFVSSDSVLFYVHTSILRSSSKTAFQSLLFSPVSTKRYQDSTGVLHIPETAAVLNVILHMLYGISCTQHAPSIDVLITAINQLPVYEVDPKTHITPSSPLYTLLLSHAPICPIDVYELGSHFDLYDLAKAASSHLLSYPLANITDEMAQRIGATYLKRLFELHSDRNDALKRILLVPPHPHPPTRACDFVAQKNLTRAWALVTAYMVWDARPGLFSPDN